MDETWKKSNLIECDRDFQKVKGFGYQVQKRPLPTAKAKKDWGKYSIKWGLREKVEPCSDASDASIVTGCFDLNHTSEH